jgi:hypothetical protein
VKSSTVNKAGPVFVLVDWFILEACGGLMLRIFTDILTFFP